MIVGVAIIDFYMPEVLSLKEKEKAYNRLKKKMENVPFWRKDLTELFGKKEDEET